MRPIDIDAIQIAHAGCPMVAHTPPIVNSTPAGTPLVTQNASFHVSPRCSAPCGCSVRVAMSLRARSSACSIGLLHFRQAPPRERRRSRQFEGTPRVGSDANRRACVH
jgi:hypothetical protein